MEKAAFLKTERSNSDAELNHLSFVGDQALIDWKDLADKVRIAVREQGQPTVTEMIPSTFWHHDLIMWRLWIIPSCAT